MFFLFPLHFAILKQTIKSTLCEDSIVMNEILAGIKEALLEKPKSYKVTVVFITVMLCFILGISMTAILRPASRSADCIADIYQDGELLTSIPLDGSVAPHRFTVTGADGCVNEIEVRSGSIGIIYADCPDRLCVRQGFIDKTGLPIVCLPHKLVIRLREADTEAAIDMIAY